MSTRVVNRVLYDREYMNGISCPMKSVHSASIASMGAVGIVPSSGFAHACGCVANGFERQMIRRFRERLGAGNRFFLEEIKARLCRYMFSPYIHAGVSLFIPGHGLIVYYNWAYSQKTMFGSLKDGVFFAPSTGESIADKLPLFKPALVFPFLFGVSEAVTNLGALMGSSRELEKSIAEARMRSRYPPLRGGGVCICDITVYVLHMRLPVVGEVLPCSCRATDVFVKAIRGYLERRLEEIREGGRWELDFSTFARLLKRTGAVIHRGPRFGTLCLFSDDVTRNEMDIMFAPDRLVISSTGRPMPEKPTNYTYTLDRLIQRSYVSALPTCRYLQYH